MPTCDHCGEDVPPGRGHEAEECLFCDVSCLERFHVGSEQVSADD